MPSRLARDSSPPRRFFVWVWLLSALALSWGPAARHLATPLAEQLRLPSTPVDRSHEAAAREWAFLQRCRARVPRGASLTARASDPAEEMALYMMALGAFPESAVFPSSYYRIAIPEGERAEYVLAYGDAANRNPPGLELPPVVVVEWKDGAVYRRPR